MCTIGSRVGRGVVGPCGGTVVGIVVVTSSRIMVGGSEEVTIGTDVVGSLVAIIGVRVGKEVEDALGIPVGNDIVDGARLGDDDEEDDSVGTKEGNEENDDDDGEELLIIVGDDGNEDAFVDNDDVGKGEIDEPASVGSNDKLGAADGNIDTSDVSASVALLSSVKDDDEGGQDALTDNDPPPEDEKVGDGDEEEVAVVPFKPSIMIIDGEMLTVGAAVGIQVGIFESSAVLL